MTNKGTLYFLPDSPALIDLRALFERAAREPSFVAGPDLDADWDPGNTLNVVGVFFWGEIEPEDYVFRYIR